jgi:hypothetical protein
VKSLYQFIIKPFNERYNNIKKIDDKELIINTSIEQHLFVSKKAVVVSTPAAFKTKVNIGDIVYVHHNIFRRYYDIKGNERNSHLNYCFIKPILNKDQFSINKEQPNVGIVKYTNNALEAAGITPGTLITFTPNSEFEFIIEGERLYCMKSNDIALTHEYEGNEKENNPSWAKSN